jgi:hypothetical protein
MAMVTQCTTTQERGWVESTKDKLLRVVLNRKYHEILKSHFRISW